MAKGRYRDGEFVLLDEPTHHPELGKIEHFITKDGYTILKVNPPFDQLPTKQQWDRKNA